MISSNTFKKYRFLFTVAIIVILLLVITGFKLISSVREYAAAKRSLDNATRRLHQLYCRDPYPSLLNVTNEALNVEKLQKSYSELNQLYRAGQLNVQPMDAADFMLLLENTLGQMKKSLDKHRIIYPDQFPFAFEKYVGGQLPAPEDISRLVEQLKIVEEICNILCQAGITELVSISREEFETHAPLTVPRTRRRRRPIIAEPRAQEKIGQTGNGQLFTSQHFSLAFKAKEHSYLDILNRIARHPMFMVTTYIKLTNKKQDFSEGVVDSSIFKTVKSGKAFKSTKTGEQDRYIILGKEDIDIQLDLDVYDFAS